MELFLNDQYVGKSDSLFIEHLIEMEHFFYFDNLNLNECIDILF